LYVDGAPESKEARTRGGRFVVREKKEEESKRVLLNSLV
jgi:hypothetical protein